jgi:hypothetical protein
MNPIKFCLYLAVVLDGLLVAAHNNSVKTHKKTINTAMKTTIAAGSAVALTAAIIPQQQSAPESISLDQSIKKTKNIKTFLENL